MSNPTTNQIKNKSSVAGNTVTEALNTLLLVQGDGTGDMLKVVYDNNNNGKVDIAEVAEAVPWTGVTSKPATFPPQTHNHTISDVTSLQTSLDGKQATLESGVNIKTINGASVLGSGDIAVSGGGSQVDDAIVNGETLRAPSQNAVFDALALKAGGNATDNLGYLNIPQNSKSAGYTCVLSDAGKHLLHPSADTTARTFTIPANSAVAYALGTTLTFINQNAAGVLTIGITTDTMRLASTGATGNRTLAANGIATAIKVTATEWLISGVGLT